jgi:CubicO group peptidase (beta-lactamase class C family)
MNDHLIEMANETATQSRRGFLQAAGLGAASLAYGLPVPLWAKAARPYPFVQDKMDSYIATRKAAGIVIGIGDGKKPTTFLSNGALDFGSNSALAGPNSLYRVYSMTKPITGIAAMMLIEDGKMKLDQPIADFLPEFADMRVLTDPMKSMDSVPAKTQITVRHLLTHTAGLGYSIVTRGPLLKAYLDNGITPGSVSKFPIPGFVGGAPTPDISTFSKRLASLPLIAEPGSYWSYSVALDLMGHLISVVSGMEFEAFLRKRIFGPLKMHSCYFQLPKSEVKRFSTNYGVANGNLMPIDPAGSSVFLDKPAFAFGGAGLVTSAHDYDRFLHMLMNFGVLDGVRVIKEETAKVAMSNLLPPGATLHPIFATSIGANAATTGFGAGARVGIGPDEGIYGWGGAAGTNCFVDTKKQVRAVGMIQYMPSNAQDFQQKFQTWVMADIEAKRKT